MNYIVALGLGGLFNYWMFKVLLGCIYVEGVWKHPVDAGLCIPLFIAINLVVAILIDMVANRGRRNRIGVVSYLFTFTLPSFAVSSVMLIWYEIQRQIDTSKELIILLRKLYLYVTQSSMIFGLVMLISVVFAYVPHDKYKYTIGGCFINIIVSVVILLTTTVLTMILNFILLGDFRFADASGIIEYMILIVFNIFIVLFIFIYVCAMQKCFKQNIKNELLKNYSEENYGQAELSDDYDKESCNSKRLTLADYNKMFWGTTGVMVLAFYIYTRLYYSIKSNASVIDLKDSVLLIISISCLVLTVAGAIKYSEYKEERKLGD